MLTSLPGSGNVAENARISRAGFDTIGQLSFFHPVVAKGTFFHNAFGSNARKGVRPLRVVIGNAFPADFLNFLFRRSRAALDQRLVVAPEFMGFLPVEVNHAVGTIKFTVLAADAFVGIMHGDAAVQFVHGFGRTTPDAGGILAVIAQRWNIMISNIRKRAYRLGDLVGPVDAVGHIVFVSAGDAAGAASDTALQVDDHGISRHLFSSYAFSILTRVAACRTVLPLSRS